MASLRFKVGDRVERAVLKKKLTTIGRGPDNDVRVEDTQVETNHAHILKDGDRHIVSTLDRKAKLLVNGKERRSHHLKDGDIVQLGGTELTFELVDRSPAITRSMKQAAPQARDPRFEQLHQFSRRLLHGDHTLPMLFKNLLDAVIDVSGAEKGFLLAIKDGNVGIGAARNIERVDLGDNLDQISDSIVKATIDRREPVIVSDAMADEKFGSARSVVELKLSSVMVVPLIARDELIGVLYLGNDRVAGLFTRDDLDVLTVFAAQASLILENALLLNELEAETLRLKREMKWGPDSPIIGQSGNMLAILRTIERVAPTDVSVLLLGETGTGKELVAREIHHRSPRKDGPFISINCGAIPENLLESELFGHVKGSFTGAHHDKVGKFEACNGGTIFLDEIGEMPPALQVKLLRVLQDRLVERVGDLKPRPIDIRVVAATNKDLENEISEGRFREDLFYRLNELSLELPPLRDRGEDVVLIAQHLLSRYSAEYKGNARGFSTAAITALKSYSWPGNIRQLENRIKKAVILADRSTLAPSDLGLEGRQAQDRFGPLADVREEFCQEYVRKALDAFNWNKAKTARALDVDARTIFRYVEKLKEA
jgi:transcriptional regulator with GAF, ATPase, and Fis domain